MRTHEEREQEAERNRRRLLQAEAAAVALLLSHRKEAVSFGLKRGFSIPRIGHQIEKQVADGITQSRVLSRTAGVARATEELDSLGIEVDPVRSLAHEVRGDIDRAHRYANNYARQWVKKAEGATVAQAANAANADTLGSLQRTAVTESAQAFGGGRAKALEGLPAYEGRPGGVGQQAHILLKVWDAQLDKLTCAICSAADGTIVGIRERFPHGEPGAVHPWCRCTWTVLTFDESAGYIEPKEPARVISLPTKPAAVAPPPPPAVKPLAPKAKPPTPKPPAAAPSIAKASARRLAAEQKAAERAILAAEKAAARKAASEAKRATTLAEKASEKEIKLALKAHGVRAIGDVRGTVKELFGRVPHPDEIRGALGLESLSKFAKFKGEAEFSPYAGIKFRGGTSSASVSISRQISKDHSGNVYAKHESLFLSKAAQGKKLGSAVIREQVSAYEKLGVETVTLNSAEVGRYYWPKVGFDDPMALQNAKERIGKWLEAQSLPTDIATKPRTMHELATMRVGERKVGKEFLLSDDYGGNYLQLDLTPGSEGFEIFKREMGMPGGKR